MCKKIILFLTTFVAATFSTFAVSIDGSIDSSFNLHTNEVNDSVRAIVVQPDGKIIIGGDFTMVHGVARNRIARLLSDGSLDTSFDPGSGADNFVSCIGLQSDGKILLGGNFGNVNGTARNHCARLNANGSLDTGFALPASSTMSGTPVNIQALSGGKTLLSGVFIFSISPFFTKNGVVRLNGDGTVDTAFTMAAGMAGVSSAISQSDGKIMAGGYGGTVANPTNIVRLLASGALDSSFSGASVTNIVTGITPLPGGGYFLRQGGLALWLQNNGSINPSASTTMGGGGLNILAALAQSDGKVIICGDFAQVNGETKIRMARLNSNGSLDTTFQTGNGPSSSAMSLAIQSDGKILVGGGFVLFNDSYPSCLTRLNNTVAGPPDATDPTVTITTAIPATTTNSTLLVQGTAADNIGVDQILYRLGTNAFAPVASGFATVASSTISWSVTLNLVPGTNVMEVKSVDAAGNESPVVKKTIVFKVTSPISVSAGAGGTTSIANGAVLEIGKRYTIVAKALAGFKFNFWSSTEPLGALAPGKTSGILVGTNASLSFVMRSNLFLAANFVDIKQPTITITSPAPGTRTNSAVTILGKATDNVQVSSVLYRVNQGEFQVADGTTNWQINLLMNPGTNLVEIQAVDTSGNPSHPVSRLFFYSTKSPLTLVAGTGGKIVNKNGTSLEVGRGYTITAMPTNKNMIFLDWSVGSTSRMAALNFLMQSNLTLQANFIDNPFPPFRGTYTASFEETDDGWPAARFNRSGLVICTVRTNGPLSGTLKIGTNSFPFSGKFDGYLSALFTVKNYVVNLQLNNDPELVGPGVFGSVAGNDFFAYLAGNRDYKGLTTEDSPLMGMYNFVVLANPGQVPWGDGIGTAMVDRTGMIHAKGVLQDGTPFSQTISHAEVGIGSAGLSAFWEIFVPLKNNGQILGYAFLSDGPDRNVSGSVHWIKPGKPGSIYPAGYTNNFSVIGSTYTAPPKGTPVVGWTPAIFEMKEGNLSDPINPTAALNTNNIFTFSPNSNNLVLSIVRTNGNLKGTFYHPAKKANAVINGVYLEKQSIIRGFFLGTNESGSVHLAP